MRSRDRVEPNGIGTAAQFTHQARNRLLFQYGACKHERQQQFRYLLSLLAFVSGPASAVMPAQVTDEQLAAHANVVVARWNGEGLTERSRITWNADINAFARKQYEAFTTITIIRVIKGNLQPGKHRIKTPYGINFPYWGGKPTVHFFGSTEMHGEVEDISAHCLWFLNPERSWDREDSSVYQSLTTYRGIQGLSKEDHFKKLLDKKGER